MTFSHPFSRYGLALVMLQEEVNTKEEITLDMLEKHLENGLNHFRMQTNDDPKIDDELKYHYIDMRTIINQKIKGNPKKGIYLCPNIISSDIKAHNAWGGCLNLLKKLSGKPDLLNKSAEITMGVSPVAGKLNNGNKTQNNARSSMLEVVCAAITNTTPLKPYLSYREKGRYIPTTIIPDLEEDAMKVFIAFYKKMLSRNINQKKLLTKKVYRKEGVTPEFRRPPIYNGNFPYAPPNAAFGVVGLLGAIGRWAKEAELFEQGQQVLESLRNRPIYIIQYGQAQSVSIHGVIVDLAKENKLSEIVFWMQRSRLIHPFDENNPRDAKGIESRSDTFHLFSSRFLQLFDKASFQDFISVRAEYYPELIELFNLFFIKQMKITKDIVESVRALGLWLNTVAYLAGKQEAEKLKKPEKLQEYKAKALIELESAVFSARRPAEVLNVIVRAGRLASLDAPYESHIFNSSVLMEEVVLEDAKIMLMAYARIRNRQERKEEKATTKENQEGQDTATSSNTDDEEIINPMD